MSKQVNITGIGTYLPRRCVSNQELVLDPPLRVEEIDRLGISARYVASDDESVVFMAMRAATAALEQACVSANSLDLIILVNWSERRFVPDIAPRVQHALGATRAFAYDLGCACTGFLVALGQARAQMLTGGAKRALVVCSDRSSRRMRPGSRASIVFGDAAAAAVLELDAAKGWSIADCEFRTDGSKNDIMDVGADGYLAPHIAQRDLVQLAGKTMYEVVSALLDRNRMSLRDIDRIVPHSGTAGVQAMLAKELGVSADRVYTNLPQIGNVTSSSIPCAMRQFVDSGDLQPEHRVITVSVGLGWQYGAVLLMPGQNGRLYV